MQTIKQYFEPFMAQIDGQLSYVHVAITEPENPAKSMFMFHDLAGRSDDFAPIAAQLALLGYRVVMVDLPGRGRSAWLEQEGYTLQMYVDVFLPLINTHGLPRNYALGQGWGAMIALLFESVIARPFAHMYLFDLPAQWSFDSDFLAQKWAAIASIRAPTAEDFYHLVDKDLPTELTGRDSFLELVQERLRFIDGQFCLSLDPALFRNLQKTRDRVYDLNNALMKSSCPVWLLNSTQKRPELRSTVLHDPDKKIRETNILSASNTSWKSDDILLPAVGAILIGERSTQNT